MHELSEVLCEAMCDFDGCRFPKGRRSLQNATAALSALSFIAGAGFDAFFTRRIAVWNTASKQTGYRF